MKFQRIIEDHDGKPSKARVLGIIAFIIVGYVIVYNTHVPTDLQYDDAGRLVSKVVKYPEVVILELLSFVAGMYGLNKYAPK